MQPKVPWRELGETSVERPPTPGVKNQIGKFADLRGHRIATRPPPLRVTKLVLPPESAYLAARRH